MDLSSHLTNILVAEKLSVVEALADECLLDMGFFCLLFLSQGWTRTTGETLDIYIYMCIYMLTAVIPIRNYGEMQAYPWQWCREVFFPFYC